jgi:FtsZ-binding cell division protein ZapB
MALQSKERYDPMKMQRLAEHLRLYQEKEQPIDFEIIVDGFKVVRRTNDPGMFSMFENFVDADTKSMEVLLYSGTSNNNDKRIFYFGEIPKEGLSGVEVDTRINEGITLRLKEKEYDDLKKANEKLQQEYNELEKEVEELEKEKEAWEQGQSPLKGILGEVGSSLVESFLRRNPNIVKSIPGGEALAGLLSDSEKNGKSAGEIHQEEAEVSFHAKDNPSISLSPEDQDAITFVNQLKAQFTKGEFDDVLIILQSLAEDKDKIKLILNQ